VSPHSYAVDGSWRALLKDLGAEPANVLRRAGLPEDLFGRHRARIPSTDYYRLWAALEAELDDPLLPITLCRALRGDVFSPPLFAALASPDLGVAVERLSQYKPLVGPLHLDVAWGDGLTLTLTWLDVSAATPLSVVTMEVLFLVALARLGTREEVRPRSVTVTELPTPLAPYEDYLGVPLTRGDAHVVRFSAEDARRPFLTSNDAMWAAFEPELRRRLAELDAGASTEERVRAALLEGLPSGQVTMEVVARRLGVSKRTLQRRLGAERTTYQRVLRGTREDLARHYLQSTDPATAEISFLLGFEEPNSFYRAFSDWTGDTPDRVRQAAATG